MILVIIVIFIIASFFAVYSYGRFAKQAKGEASYSLPTQSGETPLDQYLEPDLLAHSGESSLMLIPSNLDAFAIRALTAREAGRSLDLQYYIWKDDLTGKLLELEVLEAAERGVRVRILLDDMNTHNAKSWLAKLNTHPNISIRLFNPTRSRDSYLVRGLEMLLRIVSVNRRMHNKAWIVDGRVAVVGGRNIGNEYFGAAESRNFFDVDLLIGGEAVKETATIFDEFWNSDAALPLETLLKVDASSLDKLKNDISQLRDTISALPYVEKLKETASVKALYNGELQLYWSKDVHVISDPAEKVFKQKPNKWLLQQLLPTLAKSETKLQIISPYFVPSKTGMKQFAQLREKDVEVDILTNSLVATDVLMVHGGYAPYRKPLLEKGVNLLELKPFDKPDHSLIGSSGASLHTKAFLVDSKIGFVGSFNFDPRSANLNTEMGIIFEEPEIVKALQKEFELRSSTQFSYQLKLEDKKIYWNDEDENGQAIVWEVDPQSKWWQRVAVKIVGWLPVESQL